MKVKCLNNTGEGLSNLTRLNCHDTEKTKYPVKIGEIYTVYGQGLINNVLCYLIIGTYQNLPNWYPAELFKVEDELICFDWYYRFNCQHIATALWGYYELIHDDAHYEDLIERKSEAIYSFLKRKKEIDEFG